MGELREALAGYAHDAWAGWMNYLFSKSDRNADGSYVIPKELVERWERQVSTGYADLPENEQNSDREEADKMMKILKKHRGKLVAATMSAEHRGWKRGVEAACSVCLNHARELEDESWGLKEREDEALDLSGRISALRYEGGEK